MKTKKPVVLTEPFDLSLLSKRKLQELATLLHMEMGNRGYAVIVWTPEELHDANPKHVEERSIELGWGIIQDLQG